MKMAEMVRTAKIQKFVAKKVGFMEMQQKTIEILKAEGVAQEVISILETSQTVTYNYTFELCKEFGLKMPIVLGVK